MIAIADSGGSKTDWRFIHSNGSITQAHTGGFNPYYQPIEDLIAQVTTSLLPLVTEPVQKIYYYGAGVSSEKNQQLIQQTLQHYFPVANIEIGWDLLAAARALCGHEPGIACIMGTGSNSCLYDGKNIIGNVANLGWILADEGSGANIGRKFLVDYLRGKLPPTLAEAFRNRWPLNREEFLERVYQLEKPSAFLASFCKFIFQHLDDRYCYQLVYSSFEEFYVNNVMQYPDYKNLKVHFTGSIAFYFANILRQVAADKGILVKNILEGPIAGLTLYHQQEL